MPDLSLVLEEDIWQELCRRYDGVILALVQNVDNKNESLSVSYHGGKALCAGLAAHVQDKILKDMREGLQDD